MPAITLDATRLEDWNQTCILLKADSAVDWTFWITWFDRVLAGKDIHAEMLVPILNDLTEDDWLGDPAKVNPLFDEVLAVYLAEDSIHTGTSDRQTNVTRHIKAIQSQVSTLKDFLDVEYLTLRGQNARSSDQDDMLDLLRDLKALVENMVDHFESLADEKQALVTVRENLPAVVEKAGELAVIESVPEVSTTIVIMSASIKSLVDAGADPKLATQFAMSEAGVKKLQPSLRRFFAWFQKSGEQP